MAAQLEGVLREIAATIRRSPAPGVSTCFTGETRLAASTEVWRSLPVPLVDPDDPDAAVVVTLGAMEPEAVVDALGGLADRGVEVELRRVRADRSRPIGRGDCGPRRLGRGSDDGGFPAGLEAQLVPRGGGARGGRARRRRSVARLRVPAPAG